ncbi:MAG: hypothetical protein UHN47_01785 [Lachnospiraceae bacterium]|nr:hypothetical protein [Lachnospiraceae bacterium]
MRKMLINILATTGVSIVALAVIATCYQARFLCIETVFQSLLANILTHIGIRCLNKIEFQYFIMESILSISYTIIVVLICGKIFHWYSSTPLGVLIPLAVFVYLAGWCLRIFQVKQEIDDINVLLKRQKERRG